MPQRLTQQQARAWLLEECSEVIQELAKMDRFRGSWHEIPPGKDKTRLQMLEDEMQDVQNAWKALKETIELDSFL